MGRAGGDSGAADAGRVDDAQCDFVGVGEAGGVGNGEAELEGDGGAAAEAGGGEGGLFGSGAAQGDGVGEAVVADLLPGVGEDAVLGVAAAAGVQGYGVAGADVAVGLAGGRVGGRVGGGGGGANVQVEGVGHCRAAVGGGDGEG